MEPDRTSLKTSQEPWWPVPLEANPVPLSIAVQNRICAIDVERFLIKSFSEEQIHSLTPAQFRSMVDAAVPRYGEEVHSLDGEAWV